MIKKNYRRCFYENEYVSFLHFPSYILGRMQYSELRKDLVSGDWIVIATGRRARPRDIGEKKKKRTPAPKAGCPFESLGGGSGEPILYYGTKQNWRVQVIKNKYPAFVHYNNLCAEKFARGPYTLMQGVGHHDLVITKSHEKNFPELAARDARLVFCAFRDRYRMMAEDRCIAYTLIFQNWGPSAGASVFHPHYQMISLPIIPPDVEHSLKGSNKYFERNRKCVHCVMVDWEKRQKKRIVHENRHVIAFAPFVSRVPFEIRIFPKKHFPHFVETPQAVLFGAADMLQKILRSFKNRLQDPDYNFFIHTTPMKHKKKDNYHWHIEILPKITTRAGFEFGTGIEINTVDPDEAASILRKK